MSSTAEKKVNPILLRLPDSLYGRLAQMEQKLNRGKQVIIRDGLVAELDRMDAQQSGATVDELRALAACRHLGIDPVLALKSASAAVLRKSA